MNNEWMFCFDTNTINMYFEAHFDKRSSFSIFFRDVVIKLLLYEASTNVADNKGYFPIHLAAWKGDVEIVKILIHHGPSHSRVNEQVTILNLFVYHFRQYK